MARKLLPLAFVLTLVAAACAEPPDPEIEFGSGRRFVPMVADSLNDAGRSADVLLDQDGRPIVAYFAFEERTAEGVLPQTRPVGAPTVPGVLMATMSEEGIWTRGAMALEAQIPNVSVPFNPGFDPAIGDLSAGEVSGLDVAVDGGSFHAVWASAEGVSYATGSADPNATEQVRISEVRSEPGAGPSIAIAGGQPVIAFYTSPCRARCEVKVATPSLDGWQVDTIAQAAWCETCTTAVAALEGSPAVAYTDAGRGVSIATNDGESGWVSTDVGGGSGGQGLAATATGDGLALSYYDGTQLTIATGRPGSFRSAPVAEVAAGWETAPGAASGVGGAAEEIVAGTSIAVDDSDTFWVAWVDGVDGVRFASGDGESFEVIDTGSDTAVGATPSVAVTPDGATAYLAWYDVEHQDALLGAYGEIEGLTVAEPSPEPTGAPAPPPTTGDCTELIDGLVEIVARGVAFDTSCVDVPTGEPFTISFSNEDTVPHNVAIYPSADDLGDPLFQGEVFTGPDTREYPPVDPLDAGVYYFQCDVHPQMNGTVNAGSSGGGGGGGNGGGNGGGGGALTVTAQNVAFDTSTIELPADTESTITFDNQDTVQHNIAIYTDDTLAENLFRGDLITGPETIDYPIPPLEAGEYYFQCDAHPTMSGTVVVA
jgi:plastocyanin